MLLISSPIPSIRISPAPPEKSNPEPYSPFPSPKIDVDEDGYRANWLSLPPSTNSSPWHSSPLRPVDCLPQKGLSQDQFSLLLKLSRDQRASFGSRKVPDLRKELALKSQGLKQFERHARFLSKVNKPSCTAPISIPGFLLEPPTTDYSVPPHGVEPGYSALQIVAENSEDLVVVNSPAKASQGEEVERDLVIAEQPRASSKFSLATPNKPRRVPPSLDEITTRLNTVHELCKKDYSRSRVDSLLEPSNLLLGSADDQAIHSQYPNPRNLTLGLQRVGVVTRPTLHISRADTARDMIVTLRRRSSPPPGLVHHECTLPAPR